MPTGYLLAAYKHTSAERTVLVSREMETEYEGQPMVVLKAEDYAFVLEKAPNVPR